MNAKCAEGHSETKTRLKFTVNNGLSTDVVKNGWKFEDDVYRIKSKWNGSMEEEEDVEISDHFITNDSIRSRNSKNINGLPKNHSTIKISKSIDQKSIENRNYIEKQMTNGKSFDLSTDDEENFEKNQSNGHGNEKTWKTEEEEEEEEIKNQVETSVAHKVELITMIKRIFDKEDLPVGFFEWDEDRQYQWIAEKGSKELFDLPETLGNAIPSTIRPGDCGRSPRERPAWLDLEKFRRGQRFAMDHAFGLYFANMLSLFILFTPKDALRPMIISGKSGTPYTAFKRYLSTVHRVRNWYREDPWTRGTAAYKDMQAVRRMHASMREQLNKMSNEEIDKASTIKDPWCPANEILREDFQACGEMFGKKKNLFEKWENSPYKPKSLNQGDMAATQFAFMGLPILYPQYFGIHYATEEDFDAFCHLWRGIGYMLGMEDEYNFCRGNLTEVRQRSQDIIDYYLKPHLRSITAEWEHMTRCLVEGVCYYFPGAIYASSILYVCQLINVPIPRYRATVSFTAILYKEYQRWVLCYFTKWNTLRKLLNKLVNYAIDAAVQFDGNIHMRLERKSEQILMDRPVS